MIKYLKITLKRIYTSIILFLFDRWIFIEPPMQFVKNIALNCMLGSKLDTKCFIAQGVYVSNWKNLEVGKNSSILHHVIIDAHVKVSIGKGVCVSPGCYFTTGDHSLSDLTPLQAPISIGDDTFIGANSTILKNTRIGEQCVICTCSLVNTDLPPFSVCAGIPARAIKEKPLCDQIWTMFGYKKVENARSIQK
jgi:acetyltransferase-like isoleucine patch superfamily enzyme